MKGLNSAFGDALREARQGAGLSQEKLAFEAGIHRTYVSQLERGLKSPSLSTVYDLATALDLVPSDLIESTQERLPHRQPRVRRKS